MPSGGGGASISPGQRPPSRSKAKRPALMSRSPASRRSSRLISSAMNSMPSCSPRLAPRSTACCRLAVRRSFSPMMPATTVPAPSMRSMAASTASSTGLRRTSAYSACASSSESSSSARTPTTRPTRLIESSTEVSSVSSVTYDAAATLV